MSDQQSITADGSWEMFRVWQSIADDASLKWSTMDVWVDTYRTLRHDIEHELKTLLRRWDESLELLGGDPSHFDWDAFRPLRLEREEDWSDWLAYLIETSSSGVVAEELFGLSLDAPAPHTIERERIVGSHRADLVLSWPDDHVTHIEVKIGDQHLRKTYQTAQLLRDEYEADASRWQDIILLPKEMVSLWKGEVQHAPAGVSVSVLTWDEVCIVLRRALLHEPVAWSAFARVFVGAVEQKIIGCDSHLPASMPLSMIERRIAILEQSIDYE